uniref:Uncharacterized protein n=1 Tax=Pseudomonas syringae pv. actinidiae TaxID=103796 RepID=A0A2P0QEV9_PSESF|nr:hypothetical protein [Pseudomonas syringae pv. actinidiae]ARO45015.1 hypothetical protein [Pseudomonas syringae pv. actinidiae]ARO45109.1 hypothetical protein [Pseudomonas syringae pv. actinidiae]
MMLHIDYAEKSNTVTNAPSLWIVSYDQTEKGLKDETTS